MTTIKVRGQCQECHTRFETTVPVTGYDPPLIACPWCHVVAPLVVEPADEHWWTWVTKQPGFGEIKKALASLQTKEKPAPPAKKPAIEAAPSKRGEFKRQMPNE